MISICIITKNEKEHIKRCLSAIRDSGFGGEIVVLDTGSTDGTREIALEYTDRVFDFEWCDDFSAAKNYAISKAKNRFVLILDSDEYIHPLDYDELMSKVSSNSSLVGRICILNIFGQGEEKQKGKEWINRIFDREKFHYEGAIHEQICRIDGGTYETYESAVVIDHYGYALDPDERARKAERNISLLKKELVRLKNSENKAEDQIPYILFQIGKSYYLNRNYSEASKFFSEGLSYDLNPKLEYVSDMVETYGYALLNCGRNKEALLFENIYEEFGDSPDFKFLMGLIYMNNALFEDAISEFLKATKYRECKVEGANSFSAYYNIGVIYECLENIDEALIYYRKCGDYAPAVKRIDSIIRERS